MTEYTVDDFKQATRAIHPNVAAAFRHHDRGTWTTSDTTGYYTDQWMLEHGWVPVQEQAGSYTRTDEDGPEQYREAWQAAERAVLDERAMRKEAEKERDQYRADALIEEATR